MVLKNKYLVCAKLIIGILMTAGLIVWVHVAIGWSRVWEIFGEISFADLALVAIGIVASHVLRAIRLILCYRARSRKYLDTAAIGFVHNCLNFLLPMRLGELALPILSRTNLGIKLRDSTVTLVFIRLLDIHVLLVLVVLFAGGDVVGGYFLWATVACLTGLPVALMTQRYWSPRLPLLKDLPDITGTPRYWLASYFLTVGIWLAKLGTLTYLILLLAPIELGHAWVAITLADASSISPITGLANAGTFEAAFILPLWALGYDDAMTLPVAVAVHIVLGVVSLTMGALGFAVMLLNRIYTSPAAAHRSDGTEPLATPEPEHPDTARTEPGR